MEESRHRILTGMASSVLVLDGGMGHELKMRQVHVGMEDQFLELSDFFLPGAFANRQRPDIVRSVHEEYIKSGAQIITTNNFVVTPYSLGKVGRASELTELTESAGKIAREAVDRSGRRVLVAGSLPPLLESYQVENLGELEELKTTYFKIAEALAPYVDVLLCETLSSRLEGRAAAAAASASGKPFWVSWTLRDDSSCALRSGEPLSEAVADVADVPGLESMLVNCCAPSAVSAGIEQLSKCAPPGVAIGGYANGFQVTTSQWLSGEAAVEAAGESGDFRDGIITEEAYCRHARRWVSLGATIVGGCCGIGPSHIRKISESLA
uniref:Homocysteine S-methyltransferase n=1 Tax=Tetraselmis sp. GSL018 TaxID=582737 RepID=A0A061R188_9CHLO|mmetsp:Transcript_1119/g.2661  ORF Transcript_1119/g.2661 Transcript_1119/m.2661 type:complete len:324 (+) Transcript_1119:128-1099(+)